MEELLARGREGVAAQQAYISVSEVERVARRLRVFDVDEVGCAAWLEQHDTVEKLNLQAHLNAQSHADEYVKEALVSLDRVTTLVKSLLLAEVWRERLFPLLKEHLAQQVDSVTSYQLLYHETALANLLEVLLYHRDACESLSEDALLELCDWCCRKLAYLASDAHQHAKYKEASVQEMLSQSPLEELEQKERELSFSTGMYLTDHMDKVSLGLMTRLVSTNDAAMALLPLLDRPPWVRRGKSGIEKFINGKWQAVDPRDRMRLTQQDGQVWLALYNLVVDPGCRDKMGLTESRCEALMKLKRHFSELLLDQLPVLKDLQRVIDELAFGVPAIRASLLHRADWAELAQRAKQQQFGPGSKQLSQQRMKSLLEAIDCMCGLEEQEAPQQGSRGMPSSFKVETYRAVKEGVWEWWATYSLDISINKPPEPVTTKDPAAGAAKHGQPAGPSAGGSRAGADENQPVQQHDNTASGQEGAGKKSGGPSSSSSGVAGVVKGLRYRLRPLSENLQRALPSQGKLAVVVAGHTCQASLELPASETKNTSALAPAVWLTVGSLAGDGMALQLKLKRLDKPSERDKVQGLWYPYVPVAGALSVRDGFLD
ncbi:hypothetical protein N2152v2_006346 [Parachlorella kessleri]